MKRPEDYTPADHLDFLMSAVYAGLLDPAHRADLHASGLTDETIATQRVRTIPPHMIDALLGFEAPKVMSAYLLPFFNPRGGVMPHIRMKIFPAITTEKGTRKYLQPKRSGVRIFFPLATLDAVLRSADPLYIVEGEKKSLSVAQLGRPAIGVCGVEGWHGARSTDLNPDLDDVGLRGRTVKVIPDSDYRRNPAVHAAVQRLGRALHARGATAQLVHVPAGYKGIDDWLEARP